VKTIIFDFDGTLADSFDIIVGIIGKIAVGGKILGSKEINDLKEHTIIEIAKILEVSKFRWPFLVALGRKEMSKKIDQLKLHDGLESTIKQLSSEKINLIVLSSNSKKNIDFVLDKYNINTNFNHVYGNVGLLSKSRSISKVLKQNKIKKSDVIYIGDEARDALAAKNLGIKFIGVTWGFNSAKLLSKYPNFAVVNDASELKNKLKDWINLK
jgi:phosphoglycolate phosphatase